MQPLEECSKNHYVLKKRIDQKAVRVKQKKDEELVIDWKQEERKTINE